MAEPHRPVAPLAGRVSGRAGVQLEVVRRTVLHLGRSPLRSDAAIDAQVLDDLVYLLHRELGGRADVDERISAHGQAQDAVPGGHDGHPASLRASRTTESSASCSETMPGTARYTLR